MVYQVRVSNGKYQIEHQEVVWVELKDDLFKFGYYGELNEVVDHTFNFKDTGFTVTIQKCKETTT